MRGLFIALREAAQQRQVRKLAVGCAAVTLCGCFLTQAAVADGAPAPAKAPAPAAGTVTWGGIGWGLGIAADFDVGGARVASASVVNNIVRVNDTSNNVGVSFVLEAHYFFTDWALPAVKRGCVYSKGYDPFNCNDIGIGPFIAIEVGGGTSATPAASSPVTGYALGAMIGLHHPKYDSNGVLVTTDTSSWNFGIGYRVDPKAQVLGDGLVANAPLPVGDSIRYKTEPRGGIMLLSSFSF
jgi:hypothetical protein